MWHDITRGELFIVISLGTLELLLFVIDWYMNTREMAKQTELLEEIATSLLLKEYHVGGPTVDDFLAGQVDKES